MNGWMVYVCMYVCMYVSIHPSEICQELKCEESVHESTKIINYKLLAVTSLMYQCYCI
jgi:hypothetical protein